jgi:hypothetical protein
VIDSQRFQQRIIALDFGGAPELMDDALRWQLHNPSNEFLAVMLLNKADNHKEFKDGIQHFKFPVQNFVYADVKGNSAYHHQGAILSRSNMLAAQPSRLQILLYTLARRILGKFVCPLFDIQLTRLSLLRIVVWKTYKLSCRKLGASGLRA